MQNANASSAIRAVATTIAVIAVAVLLGGCTTTAPGVTSSSELSGGTVIAKEARFEPVITATCPSGQLANESIYIDESGSARGSITLETQRLGEIIAAARKPAVCGGLLRIVVFSRSVANTRPIVSETITPGSGTKISRILQADKTIGAIVTPVKAALADPAIDGDGTDIVSALVDASGTLSQLPAGEPYDVQVITDGLNSVDPHLPGDLTTIQAARLATTVAVPNLAGASLSFTGLGLVGRGVAPLTTYVEALTAFWQGVCARTHATCSTPTTNTIA